jgi:hypothetical protein
MSGWRCTNGMFHDLSLIMNCHPERIEGPASRGEQQVLRFAQDDKV